MSSDRPDHPSDPPKNAEEDRCEEDRKLPRHNRLSLRFRGPPIALPQEQGAASAPEALDLDVSALDRRDVDSRRAQLDLDTEGLEDRSVVQGTASVAANGWDAWSVDKIARGSSPPPASQASPANVSDAEAGEAHQHSKPTDQRLALEQQAADVMHLVERAGRSSVVPAADLEREIRDRYALDDFTGALRLAELALGQNPKDEVAARFARSSRQRLEEIYTSRLGSLQRVPVITVAEGESAWLGLDHRAAIAFSFIDGARTVEALIQFSGLERLECLKALAELLGAGAIRLE